MNQDKPPPRVLQQQLALDVYLQTLLDVVPEAEVEPVVDNRPVTIAPLAVKVKENKLPQVVLPSSLSTKSLVRLPQEPLVATENPTKLQALSVMPEWAQQEFQALFFRVDQLILATPLIELSRTIKIDRKPGKIPGQPSWFIGLLDDQDSRIGVLDTGQLIFGKSRGQKRDLDAQPFQRILVTQDKKWGLACDEILSIGKLQPEKVRWRTIRQKKPWLIGTVIEELTAIIDVTRLVPHRKNS